MKRMLVTAAAALFTLPLVGTAQQPMQQMPAAGSVAAALLVVGQRAMLNMPAAGDDMPAEKFSFQPTPAQHTFGWVLAHEANSNETLCAAISGASATPSEAAADSAGPKAQLVERLRKSFETCLGVVAKMSDAQLGDSVAFFGGRKATKARAAIALAQDWADHYAQAAAYLRAAGILPPTARRRM